MTLKFAWNDPGVESQQPYIVLTCFIFLYTHQARLHMDSAWCCLFVFYLYTKWITVEAIKLLFLDYIINDIKRREVKSVLLQPQYDRELIYITGVLFYHYHRGRDGLQDCFRYRDGKL